jgi:hypothetical protein
LEEKADSSSTEEDSITGNFLFDGSSNEATEDNEETEDGDGFTSNSSGSDDSSDSSGGNSDVSMAPPTKRRKTSGVYRW